MAFSGTIFSKIVFINFISSRDKIILFSLISPFESSFAMSAYEGL